MPQLQLPLFPHGAVHLTPDLAVLRQEDTVTYVHGSLPVFRHRVEDVKSFHWRHGSGHQAPLNPSFS
jgi:hypothetical protein